MNYTVNMALALGGTVLVLFWCFLYIKYRNNPGFQRLITAMDPKQFAMPELFIIGFGFMSLFKVNMKTEKRKKKRERIAEVHGERYADFYQKCIMGGQITYLLTFAPIGLFIGAMVGDVLYTVLVLVATIAIIYSFDIDITKAMDKKRDEMLADYPEMLSKLILLLNAGMPLRSAWNNIAQSRQSALYKEMQITSYEMENGISEIDALKHMAERCPLKEFRKFASVISQNLQKGGTELLNSLRYMNEESWEEKKHRAKQKGETASSKLLIPMMIMFAGILMMIIVPIFADLSNL